MIDHLDALIPQSYIVSEQSCWFLGLAGRSDMFVWCYEIHGDQCILKKKLRKLVHIDCINSLKDYLIMTYIIFDFYFIFLC